MDFLKTRAPFWKRARRVDGAVEGWVEAKSSDDAQAARWRAADPPEYARAPTYSAARRLAPPVAASA